VNPLPVVEEPAAPVPEAADGLPAARPVVLFDLQGVLVHGDAMRDFLRRRQRAAPWRWLAVLAGAPVLLVQKLVSRTAARATWGRLVLLGVHEARYQRLVEAFAEELVRRSRTCCRDGLRVMRQRMAAGDRVLVVTACEERLARAIFRELGLAEIEVLAAQWRDSWSGMRQALHNSGANKARLLARHGLETCVVAYSDSVRDVPMLRLAAEAVLVNATPARCKKLEQALGHPVSRVAWQ